MAHRLPGNAGQPFFFSPEVSCQRRRSGGVCCNDALETKMWSMAHDKVRIVVRIPSRVGFLVSSCTSKYRRR
jgi:hypothetical protein